ncbi:MAG: hypothetical protein NTV71_02010 [Candidatus Omnitrophica bacterium]|nr:hypothetical protein [Candidatus Omnitrophota bacterium]
MKQLLKKILIICFLSTPLQGYAEEISKAFMREHEKGTIVYIDKKASSQRSKSTFSTERTTENNKIIYKYAAWGKGDYDEYKNVSFYIEAQVEEKNGILYPIYSFNLIKNKNGDLIAKHEKKFDYTKQKIYYTISNGKEEILENFVFPMKGFTVDGPTMIHFLKTFVAHIGESSYKTFYLISEKGQLYRINIKDMGIETLELPMGKITAIKLQLIPQLGILTSVAKSLIPPTFVWYSEQEPYDWLQYDGLETGVGSTHIIASKTTLQK